jgi:hypothetical protein
MTGGDMIGGASDDLSDDLGDGEQPGTEEPATEDAAGTLATLKQKLATGFSSAGRAGLAEAVHGADFSLWVQTESGWNPRVVSGRTNQGKVNGGLFQFWYGHSWAQPYFSRGNDPRSVFTMPPADQARAVVQHFPHVTAATVHTYAQQIRNGTYHGWG